MTTHILETTIYMTVAAIIVATAAGIGASFNRLRQYRDTAPSRVRISTTNTGKPLKNKIWKKNG